MTVFFVSPWYNK